MLAVANRSWSKGPQPVILSSMKIAVFLPNWLGDLAMATPTLRAIRRHFGPRAHIVGILRPYLADVLAGTPWLDEQWSFDPHAKDRQLHSWAVAGRMRAEKFDIAVLLTNSLRMAAVAWRGQASQRIGYVRYGRGPLLTGKLYPRRVGRRLVPMPMVETYLELAYALGCPKNHFGWNWPRCRPTNFRPTQYSGDLAFVVTVELWR